MKSIKDEQNNFIINVDFPLPEKDKKTFHTIFNYIRRKLQIKLSRKNNIDSILKKCKGRFFKTIYESIKLCLNINLLRFPQTFLNNITILYNKNYLNKKIIDIYNEFNLLPPIEDIIQMNLYKKGKIEIFKEIMNSDFISLYDNYVNSDKFKRDIEQIKIIAGKRNGILYEFVAINFCTYYLTSKVYPIKNKDFDKIQVDNDLKKVKTIDFQISKPNFINEKKEM